jgi:hypothetical protein
MFAAIAGASHVIAAIAFWRRREFASVADEFTVGYNLRFPQTERNF